MLANICFQFIAFFRICVYTVIHILDVRLNWFLVLKTLCQKRSHLRDIMLIFSLFIKEWVQEKSLAEILYMTFKTVIIAY